MAANGNIVKYGEDAADIQSQVSYADAEARGRVRVWKQQLARDYFIFSRAMTALMNANNHLIEDMVRCGTVGRKRAFAKIHKMLGPGVILDSVNLDKGKSLATWMIMKPRGAILIAPNSLPVSERASMQQHCVACNFVVIGCIDDSPQAFSGLWTIEVPDHALGRPVERIRCQHPGDIVREAHKSVLALPLSVLGKRDFVDPSRKSQARVRAGPGFFLGHLRLLSAIEDNDLLTLFVRANTWIDDNALHDKQIAVMDAGDGERLGDHILRPLPLRSAEGREFFAMVKEGVAEEPGRTER